MLARHMIARHPLEVICAVPCRTMAAETGRNAISTPIRIIPPAMPKTPEINDVPNTDSATNNKIPICNFFPGFRSDHAIEESVIIGARSGPQMAGLSRRNPQSARHAQHAQHNAGRERFAQQAYPQQCSRERAERQENRDMRRARMFQRP